MRLFSLGACPNTIKSPCQTSTAADPDKQRRKQVPYLMNWIKVIILLSSLSVYVKVAEPASLDIRRLTKQDSTAIDSNSTAGAQMQKKSTLLAKYHDGKCAPEIYRHTIHFPYVPHGCSATVEVNMCYGHCPSWTQPSTTTTAEKPSVTRHCRCCRPIRGNPVEFRVNCKRNRAYRHGGGAVPHGQHLVRVPDVESCRCRPSPCELY